MKQTNSFGMSRRSLLAASTCFLAVGAAIRTSPARAATATATIYVIPGVVTKTPSGSGTAADPLRLGRGGEYALNRLIRKYMDAQQPVDVLFGDGTYQDVRLQILREGTDRDTIYMVDRLSAAGVTTSTVTYYNTTECNSAGQNCRVQGPDFAIGPSVAAPLILRAVNTGKAVFDGSGLGGAPAIDDCAMVVSGAVFGAPAQACTDSNSLRISQVLVYGLVFQNYRSGIQVTYAEDVVIASCVIQDLGNRLPRAGNSALFGTFALAVNGDSSSILIRDCTVQSIWNEVVAADGTGDTSDPSLIHVAYQGYAHDVVYLNNLFNGCSGPMIKFGYYPSVSSTTGALICAYPATPRERCTVLVGNTMVLSPLINNGEVIPVYTPQQAFFEDNSMEDVAGQASAPAAGVIVLNNQFENQLNTGSNVVDAVRQELPLSLSAPTLPGWFLEGNVITGVDSGNLLVTQARSSTDGGSAPVINSWNSPQWTETLATMAEINKTPLSTAAVASTLAAVVTGLTGPRVAGQDAALVDLVTTGTMPWLEQLIGDPL